MPQDLWSALLDAEQKALTADDQIARLDLDPIRKAAPSVAVEDALIIARAALTMEGASTVELGINDPTWQLEKSHIIDIGDNGRMDAVRITLDGLPFRLVKASRQDPSMLALTFEDEAVALLREHNHPMTASRGSMTRAQFIERMVREVKTVDIPFYSPEALKRQPTKRPDYPDAKPARGETGFDNGTKFTVKKQPADAEQIKNAATIMGVCDQVDGVTPRVRLAILCAAIGENSLHVGGTPSSAGARGVFQLIPDTERGLGFSYKDTAAGARVFLTHGFYRYGGAVELARKHPTMSAGEIASRVEGSATDGQNAGYYQSFHDEAKAIADAWSGANGANGAADTSAVLTVTSFQFTRGQDGKRETSWDAATRLAGDVQWRLFAGGGAVAFVSDDYLISKRALIVLDSIDSDVLIEPPQYDWDHGKPLAEVDLRVLADRWTVSPGSVAVLSDMGPVTGRWIVKDVEIDLLSGETQVTLTKPLTPLKEPAAHINQRNGGGADDPSTTPAKRGDVTTDPGNGNFIAQTTRPDGVRMLPKRYLTEFLAQLAGKFGSTISTNTYSRHARLSSSGLQSDHWTGEGADLHVTANWPGEYGTRLAKTAFAMCENLTAKQAASLSTGGGTYQRYVWRFEGRAYSVQVLWGTKVGHLDHVHVGVRPA